MTPQRRMSVVAAFDDATTARRAMGDLTDQGVAKSHVRLVQSSDAHDRARIGELRAEMQEEVVNAVAGPSIGLLTSDQAKGAFPGAVFGGVLGLVLGLMAGVIWTAFDASPISELGRIAIAAVSFMVAGGTIGFIAGGALKPRMEAGKRRGGTMDAKPLEGERSTLVTVEAADEHEHEIAHVVFERRGALRVDDVDRWGEPLPPQADHPRPADPPQWWTNGGAGKG